MRLEVVEAPDHSACMEQLRSRFGADCVVVHSFRVDDRYRVVVALETESRKNAAPLESAVKNVVSGSRIRWDTLVDEAPSTSDEQIIEAPVAPDVPNHESAAPQAAPENQLRSVGACGPREGAGGRSSTHRPGTRVRGFSSGGFFRCTRGRRCPAHNRTGTTGSGDRYRAAESWVAESSAAETSAAESSALRDYLAGTTLNGTIPLPVTG